jgi:hypothetical protein
MLTLEFTGGVLLLRGREVFSADWSLFPPDDAKQVQILSTFCRNRRESDDNKSDEEIESSPKDENIVRPVILAALMHGSNSAGYRQKHLLLQMVEHQRRSLHRVNRREARVITQRLLIQILGKK